MPIKQRYLRASVTQTKVLDYILPDIDDENDISEECDCDSDDCKICNPDEDFD